MSSDFAPFVRQGSGVHPEIDLPALETAVGPSEDELWSIAGPRDLAPWTRLRTRYGLDRRPPVPCDLFLWGRGSGPHPRMTRIGGTPWMSRAEPWPTCDGEPMAFACQFNFEDSRDLTDQAPGDVLLMFAADPECLLDVHAPKVHFLWAPAELPDPIDGTCVPTEAPRLRFEAFGARLRTADYPNAWDLSHGIPEEVDESAWKLPTLWGTKIGGVPFTSKGNLMGAPKGYLCELAPVQLAGGGPWPLVNERGPMLPGEGQAGDLKVGNAGEIVICAEDDGQVFVDGACS